MRNGSHYDFGTLWTLRHDCLGGACLASVCQPILLAGSQANPIQLSIDATNVYWTSDVHHAVLAVPLSGGPVRTVAGAEDSPLDITTDASNVYWTNIGSQSGGPPVAGSVRKLPLPGDGGVPETVFAGAIGTGYVETVTAIAVDAKNIYWVVVKGGTEDAALMSRPIQGGAITQIFPASSYVAHFLTTGLVVYKGLVYAAGGGGSPQAPAGGWIVQLSTTGSLFNRIWENSTATARALIIHDDVVYFTKVGPGFFAAPLGFSSVPISGGQETSLSPDGRLGVASDSTDVYFSTNDSIKRMPFAGGSPVAIVTGYSPGEIAVDEKAVYWADLGGGVWKVAK